MILITGAAGKTGQAVIKTLAMRGAAVRAFVYHADQIERVKSLGAAEVIVGSMLHQTTFKQAMLNVRAVYHICSNMNPDELTIGQQAIAAAQWAGVERFVYHSVLHPQTEGMGHHWLKLRVEEKLLKSGLNVTLMQPTAYMQNLLAYWPTLVETGRLRVPYPVETRLSLVDLDDVAEAVATVLTEPNHGGATYELVGTAGLSQIEVAAILGRMLGRPVQAEALSLASWETEAQANGFNDYQRQTLLSMFRYYADHHFVGNANVLRWLLGREPTTFEAFVARQGSSSKSKKQ